MWKKVIITKGRIKDNKKGNSQILDLSQAQSQDSGNGSWRNELFQYSKWRELANFENHHGKYFPSITEIDTR